MNIRQKSIRLDGGWISWYAGIVRNPHGCCRQIRLRFQKINPPNRVAQYSDQEFVDYVVRALVNKPEKVSSVRTVDEMGVLITLKVDPEDMGYVIGRQGQTARSLRTLLKVVGAKNNARVNLKIEEPEGSTRPPRRTETPAAPADSGEVDLNLDI